MIDRQFNWLIWMHVGGFKVCPNHDMEALKDIRVLLFTGSDTSRFVRLALSILERSLRRARYINRVIMSSLRGRGVYLWVRHYRFISVSRGLLFR